MNIKGEKGKCNVNGLVKKRRGGRIQSRDPQVVNGLRPASCASLRSARPRFLIIHRLCVNCEDLMGFSRGLGVGGYR